MMFTTGFELIRFDFFAYASAERHSLHVCGAWCPSFDGYGEFFVFLSIAVASVAIDAIVCCARGCRSGCAHHIRLENLRPEQQSRLCTTRHCNSQQFPQRYSENALRSFFLRKIEFRFNSSGQRRHSIRHRPLFAGAHASTHSVPHVACRSCYTVTPIILHTGV